MLRTWIAAATLFAGLGGAALAQDQGTTAPAETAAPAAPASEPAAPAPAPAPAPATAETKAADPNQRICKNIAMTGSRLGARKVCKTRQEWALAAEAARAQTSNNIRRSGSARSPGG